MCQFYINHLYEPISLKYYLILIIGHNVLLCVPHSPLFVHQGCESFRTLLDVRLIYQIKNVFVKEQLWRTSSISSIFSNNNVCMNVSLNGNETLSFIRHVSHYPGLFKLSGQSVKLYEVILSLKLCYKIFSI